MTSLLSWVSFSDTGEMPHLPRAVYIASDSRITWGSADHRWESGRKVFASQREPHLFGYCGDVVLPALILGQLVSAIDTGVLFSPEMSGDDRQSAVVAAVELAVASAVSTPTLNFTIHHLVREHDWPGTKFRAWNIRFFADKRTCASIEVQIPGQTQVIDSLGTGRSTGRLHLNRWNSGDASGRSRAILSSFCDSIGSGQDPLSGGAPQLAALYTSGPPRQIGMFIGGRWFLNGLEITSAPSLESVEWRDCLGQQIDATSCSPMDGSRLFFRPKGL